jgi:hypothetical protein
MCNFLKNPNFKGIRPYWSSTPLRIYKILHADTPKACTKKYICIKILEIIISQILTFFPKISSMELGHVFSLKSSKKNDEGTLYLFEDCHHAALSLFDTLAIPSGKRDHQVRKRTNVGTRGGGL